MAVNVSGIANEIWKEAAKQPGQIWEQIKGAASIYLKGYVQALANIATGVGKGTIRPAEGKAYAENARFLFDMAIAHSTQVILAHVQKFFDKVMGILKGSINKALPIALL